MEEKDKIALLREEYFFLQKTYEDFDVRLMTIKGWSSSVAIAAIGVGFYQSRFLWLFAAGASLVFWVLEATWKVYQYNHRARLVELERAFQTGSFREVSPLQSYRTWFASHSERRRRTHGLPIADTLFIPIVFFPHAVTLLVAAVLFLLEANGAISVPRAQ
jgi:hypothetical protein